MSAEKHKIELIKLLCEWKKVVDENGTNHSDKNTAKKGIDRIIKELKKPLAQRDCQTVMQIMYDLQSVKEISKFVRQSMATVEIITNHD